MESYDVTIIGGGIVGLATAYRILQKRPQTRLLLLEKEDKLAAHQTGHNSGVIHSGIYYKPGSLRAKNCRAGKQQLEEFCTEHNIPFDRCGKVIIATKDSELPGLQSIYERGQANGVTCELISRERLAELEPQTAGIAAIHVPETGIIDYVKVSEKLAWIIKEQGGIIRTQAELLKVEARSGQQVLTTKVGEFRTKQIVTCAGLQSDRIAKLCGWNPQTKIIPFRGEYYELRARSEHLCRNLIYPVPDPDFPFLGVHFTRMINGGVECGPNAVFAFAREGYAKTNFNVRDMWDALSFPGFRKLGIKHWSAGLGEMYRSLSKSAFVTALQRLVPDIKSSDLIAAPAGIRAQAVTPEGQLVDDFLIEEDKHAIHVLNAPSPAATSSLNIGETICDRLLKRFPS